jgi:hypothetical protein
MVTVAPVVVVTTDGVLKMTPLVAATSIVAPTTDALPVVSAYSVSVNDDVPSALSVVELELTMSDATLAFAAATGTLAVAAGGVAVESVPVTGVPALPPPPPQATKANVSPNAATHLMKFIRLFPYRAFDFCNY